MLTACDKDSTTVRYIRHRGTVPPPPRHYLLYNMIDNPLLVYIIHAMSRIPTLQVQILAIASPAMGGLILKDLRV
jgi:hypothetical protein